MSQERSVLLHNHLRQTKNEELLRAIKGIGQAKQNYGATNIKSDAKFNERINEPRAAKNKSLFSRKDLLLLASRQESEAKSSFRKACKDCEFRNSSSECNGEKDEERILNALYDQKIRKRVRDRLHQKEVKNGEKAAPCSKLIQPGHLENSAWVRNEWLSTTEDKWLNTIACLFSPQEDNI